jgi:hypothetical protein
VVVAFYGDNMGRELGHDQSPGHNSFSTINPVLGDASSGRPIMLQAVNSAESENM